ncbi:MAG: DNA methylase [Fibrobacter sp.]|nr:DNA methylase [Fibrobacter sp.]
MEKRIYIAIDLKSFYASVECTLRGLDPLTTNLVVADASRSEKTICLAVSPSLKALGIPGRARLFEVLQKLEDHRKRTGQKIDFITAPPQMAKYIDISAEIYKVYLKYISADDIHVYSIDECFFDVTRYLSLYKKSAHDLARTMIQDVLKSTGITATAGIGPNLFLCKAAMDILAKHIPADKDGVRIAEIDEQIFREKLWTHRPLTSFWQIGTGLSQRLESMGLFTMGDIARASLQIPEHLYKTFGINAEILIDHAWGYEPCTIADIKKFKPKSNSLGSGQVLSHAYSKEKSRIVIREMADGIVLDLIDKHLVTNAITLDIAFDRENITQGIYNGPIAIDRYGREVPKPVHGTANLGRYTSSHSQILQSVTTLFEKLVPKDLTVKRLNLTANNVLDASFEEFDLFTDTKAEEKEKKRMQAELLIKKRFGKNAILKGMDLQEGATAKERNEQIGGHRA